MLGSKKCPIPVMHDDLDLLGDDVEAFSRSQANLEGAAENFF